ncbi:MAG: LON peptidase substrate-binding domain-containing protein [Myxococcota bacterium]
MTDEYTVSPADLTAVPVFPLPGTVLLPRTFISLHVFEPRYRAMMEYCIEGPRLLAIAMLDDRKNPDDHGRPAIFPVAGLGALRRAAKLPDGRFNMVLEGIARVDLSDELGPDEIFRRSRAQLVQDVRGSDLPRETASLRALALRALTQNGGDNKELVTSISEVAEPGALADLVAAALVENARDRQRVLDAARVDHRLELTAGLVGAMLLDEAAKPSGAPSLGWGIVPGKA